MAPIHYAVAARKDFVLKALLEFNANVEIEVCFYIAVIPALFMSHLHCFTQRMLLGKDPYICVQKGMCYCPSLPYNYF